MHVPMDYAYTIVKSLAKSEIAILAIARILCISLALYIASIES